MIAPRTTENQKAKIKSFEARIDALRPMMHDALKGINVDAYNLEAKKLQDDMGDCGGFGLAFVKNGKPSSKP